MGSRIEIGNFRVSIIDGKFRGRRIGGGVGDLKREALWLSFQWSVGSRGSLGPTVGSCDMSSTP